MCGFVGFVGKESKEDKKKIIKIERKIEVKSRSKVIAEKNS